MSGWVSVCAVSEIEEEDVRRFDHGERTFAIYRDDDGAFFDLAVGCAATVLHRGERTVETADGARWPYDRLLIATGRRPRMLPLFAPSRRVVSLRSLDDARHMAALIERGGRLLVIGAGLIGLETAATARRLGVAVTVIEASDRPLARVLPSAMSALVLQWHGRAGIDIHCGAAMEALDDSGHELRCRLTNGRSISADYCLVAIGSVPNTVLAEESGLSVGRAIQTDRYLRTSDPDIYAAGDCVELVTAGRAALFEDYMSAVEQGELAAANLLGAARAYERTTTFWSTQGDLEIRGAGCVPEDSVITQRSHIDGPVFFASDRQGQLTGAFSLGSTIGGRDVRFAQLLIEGGRAAISTDQLANPGCSLKRLLSA